MGPGAGGGFDRPVERAWLFNDNGYHNVTFILNQGKLLILIILATLDFNNV